MKSTTIFLCYTKNVNKMKWMHLDRAIARVILLHVLLDGMRVALQLSNSEQHRYFSLFVIRKKYSQFSETEMNRISKYPSITFILFIKHEDKGNIRNWWKRPKQLNYFKFLTFFNNLNLEVIDVDTFLRNGRKHVQMPDSNSSRA